MRRRVGGEPTRIACAIGGSGQCAATHPRTIVPGAPNAYGVYDAVGNVWQWTSDWYAAATYGQGSTELTNPTGPATGDTRVLRGGSWWCADCTCAGYGLFYRGKAKPGAPFNNVGFRCAYDADRRAPDRL